LKTNHKPSPNCPESEYRSHPALGSTDVKTILSNAKKFNAIRTGEHQENKDAFRTGRAFHSLLLEPERFFEDNVVTKVNSDRLSGIFERNNYVVAPCKGKTAKVYKDLVEQHPDKDVVIEPDASRMEFMKEHAGKTFISPDEMEVVESLVVKIQNLQGMSRYLKEGTREQSFFGEIEGVPVKCRIDLFVKSKDSDQVIIFDPKSTAKENTPEVFVKSSANFSYYIQEWLYTEILKQNGFDVKDYIFIQASSLPYSGASYYKHDYIAMERAEEEVKRALQKYKFCKETGKWSEDKFDFNENKFEIVNEIQLPNYIFYRNE